MPTTADNPYNVLYAYLEFYKYPTRDFPKDYSLIKNIKFLKTHVIQYPKIWSANVEQLSDKPPGNLISKGGPKWNKDTFVEMILELDYKGERKFIIDRPIPIDGPE